MRTPITAHKSRALLFTLLLASALPLAAQGPDAEREVRGELLLRGDRRIDLSILAPAGAELPSGLLRRFAEGSGRLMESESTTQLAWSGIGETEALSILLEGATPPESFSLRIFMSPGVAFEDIWEVQYVLAQAGIRRVRFVSGLP